MWLEKLKELKKEKKCTNKQIADGTFIPERTVCRIFAGETQCPSIGTVCKFVRFLGGSLDDIFSEGSSVIGSESLKDVQNELEIIKAERDLALAENTIMKDKITTLTAEIELLKTQLAHKEEIIALHNYYIKLRAGEP